MSRGLWSTSHCEFARVYPEKTGVLPGASVKEQALSDFDGKHISNIPLIEQHVFTFSPSY